MKTKICITCKIEKEIEEFPNRKDSKDGKRNSCIECCTNKHKNYREKNKEKFDNYWKERYQNNKEENNKYCKDYKKTHKEYFKEYNKKYREEHREDLLKYGKQYYSENKEQFKEYKKNNLEKSNKWQKDRRNNNIDIRLSTNLINRIKSALRGKGKSRKNEILFGCTLEFLKSYLESLFKPGMTWENYGKDGWEVDHKTPCDSFDLTNYEEQLKCFHYTNLQPLWFSENRSKSNK